MGRKYRVKCQRTSLLAVLRLGGVDSGVTLNLELQGVLLITVK